MPLCPNRDVGPQGYPWVPTAAAKGFNHSSSPHFWWWITSYLKQHGAAFLIRTMRLRRILYGWHATSATRMKNHLREGMNTGCSDHTEPEEVIRIPVHKNRPRGSSRLLMLYRNIVVYWKHKKINNLKSSINLEQFYSNVISKES